MKRGAGFTLIELLVTLAVLAVLASMAVPVSQTWLQRRNEQELRLALSDMRRAIDEYKRAVDEGRVARALNVSPYPRTLEQLVEGVPDQKDPRKARIYFLRRLPRDPFAPELTAAEAWGRRSYASEPNDPREGEDVYDVYSRSPRVGLNGIPYNKW